MNNFFVQRFSKCREETDTTYSELSKNTGISVRALKYYATGEREPSMSALSAIASYFDVPTDYLLGRGLFSNWEQIMKYRDFICENLQPNVPFVRVEAEGHEPKITQIDLKSLDEKSLMLMLSALVDRIEIIEEDGKLISCTCFVLPLYVDDKGDKPSGE